MSLTKEQIFACNDVVLEKVSVPEWGGHVYVKNMSVADREQFEEIIINSSNGDQKANLKNFRFRLVQLCCVDKNGIKLFELEDVERFNEKNCAAVDRVVDVCKKSSLFTQQDVDELVKN